MKSAHEEHATLEADLFGRRLVAIEETPEGGALRVERVKALSGGGKIKARYLHKDQFEFEPTHTLLIATNHRPKINSSEHAVWRRLRLIPFPHTYYDAVKAEPGQRLKDPKLRPRLRTGTEQREAMLAWIIAGAIEWYRCGLGICPAVEEATVAWRLEEDVIARFLDETLVPDAVASISGSELYGAYKLWCSEEGRPPKSQKNFVAELLEHPSVVARSIERRRPRGVATYRGIRRRSASDPEDPWTYCV
jgi:putative DNA primase/helicase